MSHHPAGDSLSAVDGTTVYGGGTSNIGDTSYLYEKKPYTGKAAHSPVLPTHIEAPFETAEYMNTERPFFVAIGKDGLIAALQKLDTQLRNVSLSSHDRREEGLIIGHIV